MINRSFNNQGGTLLNRHDLNTSLSVNTSQPPGGMIKSQSMASLGSNEDKLQRSQLNIDRKMREDFDRLQNQLKKRLEKESAAQEQLRYVMEDRISKAKEINQKGQVALDKVKKQQRKLELQSVRNYKQNMHEIEERRKKNQTDMVIRAKVGPKQLRNLAEVQKANELA